MYVNASQVSGGLWQSSIASRTDQSSVQGLLFNILTVLLAAATLAVACMHFFHQCRRSGIEEPVVGTQFLLQIKLELNIDSFKEHSGGDQSTIGSVRLGQVHADYTADFSMAQGTNLEDIELVELEAGEIHLREVQLQGSGTEAYPHSHIGRTESEGVINNVLPEVDPESNATNSFAISPMLEAGSSHQAFRSGPT